METHAAVAALATTPMQGLVLGLLALPICLWVAYTDLSEMIIRNQAVLALIAVFAVAGFFVMPFADYAWRWSHLVVVIGIGFVMNMFGMLGAGDAKFAGAMAPFIALPDVVEVFALFAALLLLSWFLHRIARNISAIRNLAPDWKSWEEKKNFPMGLTLTTTLMAYLGLAAAG
ncbi:MAG: prepilin peptidase [Pseudomonadota bacterium]